MTCAATLLARNCVDNREIEIFTFFFPVYFPRETINLGVFDTHLS